MSNRKVDLRRAIGKCRTTSIIIALLLASLSPSFTSLATGTTTPPDVPRTISPVNGARDIILTPTLQASTFTGSDTSTVHTASQWQITTTPSSYISDLVFDSGPDKNSITPIIDTTVTTTQVEILGPATGIPTQVRVETAGDGSGNLITSQNLIVGKTLKVYSISRDANNNFVANVNAIWSFSSKTGGVADGDLAPWGNMATMTGHLEGTGVIRASVDTLNSVDSGTITVISSLPIIEIPKGALTTNTTYFWRVRYQDNYGNWSAWSMETYFTTITSGNPGKPVNFSPANTTFGILMEPTLLSSAFVSPDGAATHAASQWQITVTPKNYAGCIFDSSTDPGNLTTMAIPSGILTYNTIYYWHVRYQDSYGNWSAYSLETSFTTLPAPLPRQPTNTSPANSSAGISLSPVLNASDFTCADEKTTHTASRWQLLTRSGNSAQIIYDSSIDASNKTTINIPSGILNYNTTYYWHVKYGDSNGNWSAYSTETYFITATVLLPRIPANTSPSNATINVGLTPTMTGSPFTSSESNTTHAASQWQITTRSGDYSQPVYDSASNINNKTSLTVPPGILKYSTTYYWHVRYQDNLNNWSAYSPETSFVTTSAPPIQPKNSSPSNAATNILLTTTLASSSFASPDNNVTHSASQWQITTKSGDYSKPVFDSKTDNNNKVSITIPSGILTNNTTYYWHVRYLDSRENWTEYSAESYFTTLATTGNINANFLVSPAQVSTKQAVILHDMSTGSITTWTWDLGDKSIIEWSTQTRPKDGQLTHTYSAPGQYTVSLKVAGPAGNNIMNKPNCITVSQAKVSLPWIWIAAGIAVIGIGVLFVIRRRKKTATRP